MRKRRLPIGWPRRDPRHYRFPLPNAVWKYKLKPIEFVILSYLCCQRSHGGTNLSPEIIAKGIHLTVGTVEKYLASLVDRGLITNEYTPTFQCADSRKFFTLPNEIFLLDLSPSAFIVYAYLLLIEDRRTHTCHPSYNTIAAETGLTKNTVMKNISVLLDAGLITMEHSCYFDEHGMKWKGTAPKVSTAPTPTATTAQAGPCCARTLPSAACRGDGWTTLGGRISGQAT